MPRDMPYPMIKSDDGEEYPLTFVCQIDCADLAELYADNPLPKEGMLYFFAALDEYLGYDAPYHTGAGEWPKGTVLVKYAKQVNPETFESYIMVDDNDEALALPAMKTVFSKCEDSEDGPTLLEEVQEGICASDACVLLRIRNSDGFPGGLAFPGGGCLDIVISENDLKFGNWKRAKGFLYIPE